MPEVTVKVVCSGGDGRFHDRKTLAILVAPEDGSVVPIDRRTNRARQRPEQIGRGNRISERCKRCPNHPTLTYTEGSLSDLLAPYVLQGGTLTLYVDSDAKAFRPSDATVFKDR